MSKYIRNLGALLVVLLASTNLTSCDPADIRDFTIRVPGGERQADELAKEINPILLRNGFYSDFSHVTSSQGELIASWRKKFHPNDETTRIACFVFYNRSSNVVRAQLILFPGTKLPADTIRMFEELKLYIKKKGA